jgi:pimeloyl-ACP methyl ester carboxylesterase
VDGQASERALNVNGLTFNVVEAGSGPPVLLLHGFPDSSQLWRYQIPALVAAGRRVIAPDLRGFGKTDRPPDVEAYRIRNAVADILGLLDAFGIDRTAVVGHDWGAGLAWVVAAFAPDRVERLAVVSVGHPAAAATVGLRQRQMSWYMLWFLFPGVAEEVMPADDWAFFRRWAGSRASQGADPDLERQIADLSRPGALTAALNWYRANIDPVRFVNVDPESVPIPSVGCPTMGVWSTEDFALGERQMTNSERFVTGPWRYERLDGVDHWVPVHAPERLNELLLDFLGSPEQPGG